MDPALFFPERGDNFAIKRAKAVCDVCAVQAECLNSALERGEEAGIWGGATRADFDQIRRQRTLRSANVHSPLTVTECV